MSLVVASPRIRIELPELHDAQQQIVDGAGRFNVLNCGRRFGKDVLGIDRLVETALDGYPVGWYSPTYKMLTEDWREASSILRPVTQRRSEQEHRLDLYGGGVVDMWSLDAPDTSRGRRYKRVIVNEAAMVPGLRAVWQEVIRPTLADYQGDGWFMSTPRGMNDFWALYQRGVAGEPGWRSWTFPTSANPFIAPREIEAARHELPEKTFSQEYEAAFVADEGAVFRRIGEAAVLAPRDTAPEGHTVVIGCDWGKVQDYSVFSVVDATAREQLWQDRSNHLDYNLQLGRLASLCLRYRPAAVVAERNAMGDPLIERLRAAGVPVYPWTATNTTKHALVEALSLAFEGGRLKVLRDPVLTGELQAYEAVKLPSGMLRYSAPEGLHDDCVMALGLAWLGCLKGERRGRSLDFAFEEAE